MASAGPSNSAQDPSGSADAPRGDPSSNTQSPVTSDPGFKAAPPNPNPPSPSPAPPTQTQTDEVTPGPSGLGTDSPTSPQPQNTQTPVSLPSDEPRNRLFEADENAHPGYAKYTHLDGGTYYRHLSGRLLTPDDVTQPRIRECLERLLSLTFSTLEEQNLLAELPNDAEIVAERMNPEIPEVFYFVSQSLRQVLNYGYDCPCPNPTHRRQECPSPKLRLDKTPGTRFWEHLASYPMHITALPPYSEAEFLMALTHGANERILDERKSMFPYTDQQAQRFMQVYRDLKCVPYSQGRHSVLPAVAWHISRVMIKIEAVRELYHYGTKEARLYRDIAVETPTWRGHLVDVLLFCVFFNSHRTYRARLESTRPKGHVYLPDFRDLMSSLLVEWSDSNLLATVFVSANVAFLAVPNITALPQTASLCSALFSMLSIVIGVHHVWRHRRRADADDEEASQYLRIRSHHGHRGSLTPLSCFLALPLAALLWAILSFTIAVGAFSFTSVAGGGVHTRALLAGVFGVLMIFAVLTLLVFWDAWRSPPTSEPEDDYARGVGVGKYSEREGWIRHIRRRMRVARAGAMDSIQVRMKKTRVAIRKALNNGRKTGQTVPQGSDVRSTKEGSGIAVDTLDHAADV